MSNLKLKSFLKTIKLHESNISMILGAVVLIVVAVLIVNYFKNLPTGNTLGPGTSTESSEKYTVKKGDTLWAIAQEFYQDGFRWNEIAQANGIEAPYTIEIGQEIEIPKSKAPAAFETGLNSDELSQEKSVVGASYTVVKGDNLWSIAVRAYGDGYRWVEIARENKLANPNFIHSGNVLTIPR